MADDTQIYSDDDDVVYEFENFLTNSRGATPPVNKNHVNPITSGVDEEEQSIIDAPRFPLVHRTMNTERESRSQSTSLTARTNSVQRSNSRQRKVQQHVGAIYHYFRITDDQVPCLGLGWIYVLGLLFGIFAIVAIFINFQAYTSLAHMQLQLVEKSQQDMLNFHKMELQEARAREKRLLLKLEHVEKEVLELTKVILPNYIQQIRPTHLTNFETPYKSKRGILLKLLEEIKEQSPKQSRDTFLQLFSVIGVTYEEDPRPAGIVILLSPKSQSDEFQLCFVNKLANGINRISSGSPYHVTILNLRADRNISAIFCKNFNKNRLNLHQTMDKSDLSVIQKDLHQYFKFNSGRAVVVYDLETVQTYEMLMVLQAFTDNINAPEKQAVFIFTLNVPQDIYEKYNWVEQNGARLTYDILKRAWTKVLSQDKISPLIARIAQANILIREGDSC